MKLYLSVSALAYGFCLQLLFVVTLAQDKSVFELFCFSFIVFDISRDLLTGVSPPSSQQVPSPTAGLLSKFAVGFVLLFS